MNNVMRFIATSDYQEFMKWVDYMVTNHIEYKAYGKVIDGEYKCDIEIIGKSSEEIEKIKNDIGFYFDWKIEGYMPSFLFAKISFLIIERKVYENGNKNKRY